MRRTEQSGYAPPQTPPLPLSRRAAGAPGGQQDDGRPATPPAEAAGAPGDHDATASAQGRASSLTLDDHDVAPGTSPAGDLPEGVSPHEKNLVMNAIYNEANGKSPTEMAKVAQAITNYAKRQGVSIEAVVMGGRQKGAISEHYLHDDPSKIKDGNHSAFQAQASQIEAAAIQGLNQAVPGFSKVAGHWRGNGRSNHFF